jgi:DNA-binding transcriptional LysR family regulator
VSFAVRDWPTRLGLVSAGLGIALVLGFASPAMPDGVRWIPERDMGDGLRRQVCVVTTHDASPAARAMVRALENEATDSLEM